MVNLTVLASDLVSNPDSALTKSLHFSGPLYCAPDSVSPGGAMQGTGSSCCPAQGQAPGVAGFEDTLTCRRRLAHRTQLSFPRIPGGHSSVCAQGWV